MIKVSVLYPNAKDCRFDFDYYCKSHMPMVRDRVGGACHGISVDEGIAGGAPGTRPAHVASAHLFFESVEAFQAAFSPHAREIMADIPNYTNVQPIIQISRVLINATRNQTGELHLHMA
ncbi:MAG: EthD family reductase [Anaeromyxobacteraceae bacterium]